MLCWLIAISTYAADSAPMSEDRLQHTNSWSDCPSTVRVVTDITSPEHNLADRPGSIANIWISFDPHLVIMNLLFPWECALTNGNKSW